jgi:hypothetical protein
MIESLMLIGIGICAGCLLVLMFVRLVHRRSARLTTRYLVETAPPAVNALHVDKDRLRAEFATSVRRLEVSVEEMRNKAAGQLGEIGRQRMEIQRLRLELDKKMALVFALRYRDKVRKNIVRRMAKLMFYASSARNAGTSANFSAHFWVGRWRIPVTRTWRAARPDDRGRKTQPAIVEAQWPVLDRVLRSSRLKSASTDSPHPRLRLSRPRLRH